ncbi:unnamed protein product, partial [Thlaspi arvense]
IQQNGACFQPNTVKNHCDVAVNSYYQKKASSGATCDFSGAATISSSPPSTASSCLTGSSYACGLDYIISDNKHTVGCNGCTEILPTAYGFVQI